MKVELGQGEGDQHVKNMAELMADPEFMAAYNMLGSKIYSNCMAAVPLFAGATSV